jgi:hypothetical protein|tara:strand:- start:1408 stop:1683 length:276 start_codon:yes stop_codon:yes gene_type:complete
MITLTDRIMADMKNAMRSKDKERLEAIRLLRAAIQRREVDERITLNDDDVQKVIKKMIKQSNKAIVQFEKGNRPDLIAKDKYLINVLEEYQ